MGARAKLATNLVLGLNRAVLAEGMVFAQQLGIEPEAFLQLVLATPARSDAASIKGAQMVNNQFEPQSRIRQHLKDVRLMLGAAQACGQHLPLSATHAALMQAAVDAGDGELDNAAMTEKIFADVVVAFEEDRRMIEAQQKVMTQLPGRPMIPIAADAGLNQARWLIDRMAKREGAEVAS